MAPAAKLSITVALMIPIKAKMPAKNAGIEATICSPVFTFDTVSLESHQDILLFLKPATNHSRRIL